MRNNQNLRKQKVGFFPLTEIFTGAKCELLINSKLPIDMSDTPTIRILTVENKMGIHARPAAMIVRISNKYAQCEVWVEKDGENVNGKSIMSLMMLAAGKGSEVKFLAKGEDSSIMLDEIEDLFKRKFDEE